MVGVCGCETKDAGLSPVLSAGVCSALFEGDLPPVGESGVGYGGSEPARVRRIDVRKEDPKSKSTSRMQISVKMSNFSAGESDSRIRKPVAKKKIKLLTSTVFHWDNGKDETTYDHWMNGAVDNGYKRETAQRIWDDVLEFASYAFNKSHSAGYAILVMTGRAKKTSVRMRMTRVTSSCQVRKTRWASGTNRRAAAFETCARCSTSCVTSRSAGACIPRALEMCPSMTRATTTGASGATRGSAPSRRTSFIPMRLSPMLY